MSSHYDIREEVWLHHWKKLLWGEISLEGKPWPTLMKSDTSSSSTMTIVLVIFKTNSRLSTGGISSARGALNIPRGGSSMGFLINTLVRRCVRATRWASAPCSWRRRRPRTFQQRRWSCTTSYKQDTYSARPGTIKGTMAQVKVMMYDTGDNSASASTWTSERTLERAVDKAI